MNFVNTTAYVFKCFTTLTELESEEVLRGRNDPFVRRWMKSDRTIGLDEHRRFMLSLQFNARALYIKIERAGRFVGVYSINDVSKGIAQGGFWVTAFARERLLPLNVVFQGMNYMFEIRGIQGIYGFQKKDNQSVVRLNELLGLSLSESSGADEAGVERVEITRQRWNQTTLNDVKLLKLLERTEKLNGTT